MWPFLRKDPNLRFLPPGGLRDILLGEGVFHLAYAGGACSGLGASKQTEGPLTTRLYYDTGRPLVKSLRDYAGMGLKTYELNGWNRTMEPPPGRPAVLFCRIGVGGE